MSDKEYISRQNGHVRFIGYCGVGDKRPKELDISEKVGGLWAKSDFL